MPKNSISDIAAVVARKQKISKKEASDIVSAFFRVISEGLREDRQVKVRGLGTFKVTAVKARESVNVNTGERLVIEGHDKVSFVPDTAMKELVNKPFAQFTTVAINEGVNFESIDAASDAEERKTEASVVEEETSKDVETLEEADDNKEELSPAETDVTEEEPSTISTADEEPSTQVSANEKPSKVFDAKIEDNNQDIVDQPKEETVDQSNNQIIDQHKEQIVDNKTTDLDPAAGQTVNRDEPEEEEEEEVSEEEQVSREYFDEQMSACRRRCNRNLFLGIGLLVVGLVAGFFVGRYALGGIVSDNTKDTTLVAKNDTVQKPVQEDASTAEQTVDSVQKDSDNVKPAVATESTTEKADTAKTEKESESVSSSDVDLKKLNSDRRLRFGAYEITGVEKVVRLKAGQTMKSYSNKTLGQDMVVYFQVLNGVDNMQAGDVLKVPKIRLKKQYRR